MDVSYFIEFNMIVKHGNLSEAAKELHTTQPVLSRHISNIEKQFGITLFDRQAKPMELTPAGSLFLKESTLIANEYVRLTALFNGLNEGSMETIKISGLLDSGVSRVFRKAKAALSKAYPTVSLKIVNHELQTPFDLLRSGGIDIAIEPISDLIDIHDLESIEIIKERPHIVVDESHEVASRKELASEDLCNISFTSLRSNNEHALRKHLQGICKEVGLEGAIPKTLSLSPVNTYSELFLMGLGEEAVMLPETTAKMYTSSYGGQYVAIPFNEEKYFYDIRAFYLPAPEKKVVHLIEQFQAARDQIV